MNVVALFTIADQPPFDVLRGVAAVIGSALVVSAAVVLVMTYRRIHSVPSWVRLSLLGWILGDIYVGAREVFEIGRPLFLFGLPLALAWETCALTYLHKLWMNTDRMRRRQTW